jgi:hypothetical protein
MKCCGILFGCCNQFLYISLSASVYSKVPKQSRVCLSIFEYKPCCKILFGEKNIVINCAFILIFENGVILTPWYC